MKKGFLLIMALVLLCSTSCGILPFPTHANVSQEVEEAQIGLYDMMITCPAHWKPTEINENFDFQRCSGVMYMGVFAYTDEDMGTECTVAQLFEEQNQDILEGEENTVCVQDTTIQELDGMTLYSAMYTTKDSDSGAGLAFFLADLKGCDHMAWVMFTGLASQIRNRWDELEGMVRTIRYSNDATSFCHLGELPGTGRQSL